MPSDPFSQHLDTHPEDWTTRLVYADWLEEQGRYAEAECQRWMVRKKRKPFHFIQWSWSDKDKAVSADKSPSLLPGRVYKALPDASEEVSSREEYRWRLFLTRREAETSLCKALIECGEICAGV